MGVAFEALVGVRTAFGDGIIWECRPVKYVDLDEWCRCKSAAKCRNTSANS